MINTKTERDKMQTHTRDKIQTERERQRKGVRGREGHTMASMQVRI